jgi:hypothetical protein
MKVTKKMLRKMGAKNVVLVRGPAGEMINGFRVYSKVHAYATLEELQQDNWCVWARRGGLTLITENWDAPDDGKYYARLFM